MKSPNHLQEGTRETQARQNNETRKTWLTERLSQRAGFLSSSPLSFLGHTRTQRLSLVK